MAQTAPQAAATSAATPGFDERIIDLKLAAVEARTETKFAQLIGKLDLIAERLGGLNTQIVAIDGKVEKVDAHTRSVRSTIIATVIGTGIAVAALAWGGVQIFQGGMGVSAGAFQAGMAVSEAKKQ